jgi:uncharacterized protein
MVYGIVGIAMYYLQDYIFFRPQKKPRNEAYLLATPFKEINIPYDQNSNINIVQFLCAAPSKGVVLFFHGNKNNISWYAHYAPIFTAKGYEVWMIDYPGFGKSTGVLTEEKLYEYALLLYKMAASKFKPTDIIIYGKSMGTGVAAYLASRKDCKRLILETPYYSMQCLAAHYFPLYPVSNMLRWKLPTNEYLPTIIAPITMVHGTEDGVVPYSQSKKLSFYLKPTDQLITIPNGSHNNLLQFTIFQRKLDSLLRL